MGRRLSAQHPKAKSLTGCWAFFVFRTITRNASPDRAMKIRIEIAVEVKDRADAALLTERAAEAAREAAAQTTSAGVSLATWTLRRDRKHAA